MEKEYCILVVEDQEDNYELLREFLLGLGYQVKLAFNGLEAIEAVQNNGNSIDLVLMDIKMPIMNGIESFEEIRKSYPKLPIIAQTAYAMEGDRDVYMEKGFNDYVSKPIDLFMLKSLIESFEKIN